jgi:hypothetical protein
MLNVNSKQANSNRSAVKPLKIKQAWKAKGKPRRKKTVSSIFRAIIDSATDYRESIPASY